MVKYTFSLKIKNSDDVYQYTIDLLREQENYPERFFTQEEQRKLRTNLQRQSDCGIDNPTLNHIVRTWIQDIQEGNRDSSVSIEFTSILDSKIEQLNDSGNQEVPQLVPPDLESIYPELGALPPLNFP